MGVILMALAYLISAFTYLGVGLQTPELGGYQSNATSTPQYVLKGYKAAYANGGVPQKYWATDAAFVTISHAAELDYTAKIASQTFGVLITAGGLYTAAILVSGVFSRKFGMDERQGAAFKALASIVFALATILVWGFVQSDLMFLLGNENKAASYLAFLVVSAQAFMYFAGEQESIRLLDNLTNSASTGKFTVAWAVAIMGFLVGPIFTFMLLSLTIFEPLNVIGTSAFPETFRPTLGLYLTSQLIEVAVFVVSLISRIADAPTGERPVLQFIHGDAFTVLRHALLYSLAATYAFAPMQALSGVGAL